MRLLDNLQRAIFETRSLIQAIPEVRKMVFYDVETALEQVSPTIEQTKEYFVVSPIFDMTKPPFDKNTIVSLSLNQSNFDAEAVLMRNILKISILTRSNLWELKNNKVRPLEISNYIIESLHNKKISPSHKLFFATLQLAILDEDINGYTLTFFLEEGSGLDEQF